MTEQELQSALEKLQQENEALKAQNIEYELKLEDERMVTDTVRELYKREAELLHNYATAYVGVLNSKSWKMGIPCRWVGTKIKNFINSSKQTRNFARGVKLLFTKGPRIMLKVLCKKVKFGTIHNYYLISNERQLRQFAEYVQIQRHVVRFQIIPAPFDIGGICHGAFAVEEHFRSLREGGKEHGGKRQKQSNKFFRHFSHSFVFRYNLPCCIWQMRAFDRERRLC